MGGKKETIERFSTLEECPPRSEKPINSRFKDREGQTFGNLDVIYYVGRKKKKTIWLCKCRLCGMYRALPIVRLTHDGIQNCGCVPKEPKQHTKAELIGQTINGWQVIGLHDPRVDNHGEVNWDCICPSCGKIVARTYYQLHSLKLKGCRNCRGKNAAVDITGQRFGRLTALEYVGTDKGFGSIWKCLCDCGNTINVKKNSLMTGGTRSCGCLNTEQLNSPKKDLTNQQFGFLKVVKYAGYSSPNHNNGSCWVCKCEKCGAEIVIAQHSLASGQMSCGCVKSKSEVFITEFLIAHQISFKKQYQFDDLKSTKGYPLRFDFAILNSDNNVKMLIEYQGQQHFEATPHWGGEEGYARRKEYDNLKRQYCNNKGLKLVEITYRDNLEEKLGKVFNDS